MPRGWTNLWVPGRSNSSDVAVHAAIRVQPAVSMMVNRTCYPQKRTVEKIASALSVEPEDLWPKYDE